MLTAEGCQARRDRLWDALGPDVEWAVIADPRHVQYLAGFWVNPLSFSATERSVLLLQRGGDATLVADNFTFRARCADPCIDREWLVPWYDHQHSVRSRDRVLVDSVREAMSALQGAGVYESRWLPRAALPETLQVQNPAVALEDRIQQLRRRKHADEVALLERCMRAGAAGQAQAARAIRAGLTELDLYREIQTACVDAAGAAVLVYGDFQANSPDQPKAGGLPRTKPLEDGELIILDFSVVLCGYRSDFTNTLAVGAPTSAQTELAQACIAALDAGQRELGPGVAGSRIHEAASEPLQAAGYGPIPHHAGHGLGLAHPEPPILVPESEDLLEEGDVVTLEPGAYITGVGGVRVEHNFLITDSGARQLSDHRLGLRVHG